MEHKYEYFNPSKNIYMLNSFILITISKFLQLNAKKVLCETVTFFIWNKLHKNLYVGPNWVSKWGKKGDKSRRIEGLVTARKENGHYSKLERKHSGKIRGLVFCFLLMFLFTFSYNDITIINESCIVWNSYIFHLK